MGFNAGCTERKDILKSKSGTFKERNIEIKGLYCYRKCDIFQSNIYKTMPKESKNRSCFERKRLRSISSAPNLRNIATILFIYALMIVTSGSITPTGADVQEDNSKTTYSHRRLGGRERREIQKELLSMLRLTHRPRPVGDPARGIQHDSAPLYMLGLYNTVSGFANIFEERIRQAPRRESDPNYPQKRESPLSSKKHTNAINYGSLSSNTYTADVSYGGISVGPFSDRDPYDVHVATNTAWYRYRDAQKVFTNEVGVPLVLNNDQSIQHMEMHYEANDNGLQTNSLERQLLGEADVVMSFVGTNQINGETDEDTKRGLLKRHRSFFFDVSHVPVEDILTAAKFRVYKDITSPNLGNVTLRVNVYQAMVDGMKSFGLYMLGSRLVEADQEGWLVFDVTSACRDWMKVADSNLGIRVAVETLEGRSLNLNKAGIVGRRGDSSKQAFLVGFFSEHREHLPNHLKYRRKRNTNNDHTRETENARDGYSYSKHHNSENDLLAENLVDGELGSFKKESYSYTTTTNSDQHEDEDDDPLDINLDENGDVISNDNNQESMTEDDDETNDVESNDLDNGEQRGRLRRSKKRGRKNKGTRRRKPPKNVGACHRDELYVNFQDLNWEGWIIAPAGYRAYKCMGECTFPLNDNMNATNHAIVQTLVQLIRPRRLPKLPKPCCSPTKLEPISVLYYDDSNNVVYKRYKNMVVKACGCQ